MYFSEKWGGTLNGILMVALFSCAAFYIAGLPWVKALSFSPLIVGILLGTLYANSLRNHLPESWVPGLTLCSKKILRLGIILYGFKVTVQDVMAVGTSAIIIDAIIVSVTILGGIAVGRLLKMDRGTALLTSVGSGICGAAAILGAESAIDIKPYKTAVAVSTVVIFGTISMFLYPILWHAGVFFGLTDVQMGIYAGATIHEVAHVVGAGNALGPIASDPAIITKMIRVMMLVPVLFVISFTVRAVACAGKGDPKRRQLQIPWFALGFLAVIVLNSWGKVPEGVVSWINDVDTFLLTMAMVALGMETQMDRFKQAGAKPFILASILYLWLLVGGYVLTKYLA